VPPFFEIQNLKLKIQNFKPPVPAGSRVTFFTGLKKVTKERTCAALGMLSRLSAASSSTLST
jgi:hypothetical protein